MKTLGLELDDGAIHDTIVQLNDAGYVEFNDISYESGGGAHISGLQITGRGMQVLGQWPRFESLVSPLTFAAALDALAEYSTEEDAMALKRAADFVRQLGVPALKSLVIGAASALARAKLGL